MSSRASSRGKPKARCAPECRPPLDGEDRRAEDDERRYEREPELAGVARRPGGRPERLVRERHEPEQREARPDQHERYEQQQEVVHPDDGRGGKCGRETERERRDVAVAGIAAPLGAGAPGPPSPRPPPPPAASTGSATSTEMMRPPSGGRGPGTPRATTEYDEVD